jgi:hypothetical protein
MTAIVGPSSISKMTSLTYSGASSKPRVYVYATASAVPGPDGTVRTWGGKSRDSQKTVEVQEED